MKQFAKFVYEQTEFLAKIKQFNFEHFINYDLEREIENMERVWQQMNFIPKFCHMDFMGSNILVSCENGKKQVSIIDYEYSTYSCRGYDLATFMGQWGIEPMQYEKISLPNDSVIERVVSIYRRQCERIEAGYCQQPENSLEQIMDEVKLGFCVYALFFTAFFTQNKPVDPEEKPMDFDDTIVSIICALQFFAFD